VIYVEREEEEEEYISGTPCEGILVALFASETPCAARGGEEAK
jgi:hypothetical protein